MQELVAGVDVGGDHVEATRAGRDDGLHADVGAGVAELAGGCCDRSSAAGHAEGRGANAELLAQRERGVLAVGGAHGSGRRADQRNASSRKVGAHLRQALKVK